MHNQPINQRPDLYRSKLNITDCDIVFKGVFRTNL